MDDATKRSLEDVLSAERQFERLSEIRAEGIVLSIVLNYNVRGSNGIHLLLPGSMIKEHKHYNDCEEYTFPDGHVEKCSMGESHSLKNETNEILIVKYRKRRIL